MHTYNGVITISGSHVI